MISHEEAQELHSLLGKLIEYGIEDAEIERARELAALIVADTTPSAVSYAPCIQGVIEIGDAKSEFLIPLDPESSTQYSQWGASNTVLWPRVDLLESLAEAASEWASENLCRTCRENLLDDGEGYDGECADCADRNPENREDDDDD